MLAISERSTNTTSSVRVPQWGDVFRERRSEPLQSILFHYPGIIVKCTTAKRLSGCLGLELITSLTMRNVNLYTVVWVKRVEMCQH